jgi:hypothetical protein
LLRFDAGAAAGVDEGSGISVERFAASAVSAGVSEGCEGGGCRRFATGFLAPQPEEITERMQRAARTPEKITRRLGKRWFGNAKALLLESAPAANGSNEIFNGPLAS